MLTLLARVLLAVGGMALVAVEVRSEPGGDSLLNRAAHLGLTALAALNILLLSFLVLNQLGFPLHLNLMEGAILQHYQRAASFQPIYPEPTPAYAPLAYNPLFYVISVPFGWVLGDNLVTLRLVALLGMLGSGVLVYRVVREKTASRWWGLLAAGLFAAAYRVMNAYLNTAHADSWLLFTMLLGTYLIGLNHSRAWNLAGVLVLVASFWFKQHGALLAIGGVLYLTWREGLRKSIPYWIVAALLGPGLYLLGGNALFGSHFHYFTWEVPRAWSELSLASLSRYVGFIGRSYLFLSIAGGLLVLRRAVRDRARLDVWHVQFVFACLSGLMGALDTGSADNVFIPMGTWFIIFGTLGLHEFADTVPLVRQYRLHLVALYFTFAVFLYNPLLYIVSPDAGAAYDDLVAELRALDGPVYAPWQAQLPRDYSLYPTPHWVALDDMVRGPGRDTSDSPDLRKLLEPALNPDGPAYILVNYELAFSFLDFLNDYYVLEEDYGQRFESLRTRPGRFDQGYPRYLYRYDPEAAAEAQ